MKVVALIARILLGLMFVMSGGMGFLPINKGPMPTGLAGQFVVALMQSHFIYVVSGLQLIGGALLLANRYVPLALTLLGPVIVNIFLYHLFMDQKGLPIAIVVVALWFVVYGRYRKNFEGIFAQKA